LREEPTDVHGVDVSLRASLQRLRQRYAEIGYRTNIGLPGSLWRSVRFGYWGDCGK